METEIRKVTMAKVGGQEYPILLTVQSWRLLEKEGINPETISARVKVAPITTLSTMFYYAMPKDYRQSVDMDKFCESLTVEEMAQLNPLMEKVVARSLPPVPQSVDAIPAAEGESESKKN